MLDVDGEADGRTLREEHTSADGVGRSTCTQDESAVADGGVEVDEASRVKEDLPTTDGEVGDIAGARE